MHSCISIEEIQVLLESLRPNNQKKLADILLFLLKEINSKHFGSLEISMTMQDGCIQQVKKTHTVINK